MKTIKISKKYANVLKHRLNKAETPLYEQIRKLALSGYVPKKELKTYIQKAKKQYDALLYINNTKTKGATTSPQKGL